MLNFQQCLSVQASSMVLFLGSDSSPDWQSWNRTATQEGTLPLTTPPLHFGHDFFYGKWQVVSDNMRAQSE